MDHALLARQTLKNLDDRLHRLNLVIYGDIDPDDESREVQTQVPPANVANRVESLEKALDVFESQSNSLQELLRLNKQWAALAPPNADTDYVVNAGDEQHAATVILSHASQYNSVASRLRSIQDVPLADASACVDAISQIPKMEVAAKRAQQHQLEIEELRKRSAEVVGRWHSVGVLSLNGALGEWEDRLMNAERTVRQAQARRRQEIEDV
ncbi:hypothetical protein K461DRAFT_132844 [Myriangium duriaei CBS 260.36]|uniref:Uncharacterized protein n=1 Tax=Myriangium duriaei CBS 260.36 TaxID=1168546 RepID=A0A9P4J1L1_9PEZI|nr:hypothetical protein K461DRAFT_132844 [Myriangium duriaei CBS 260.36]